MGLFPRVPEGCCCLFVAIHKFSKRAEVEVVCTVSAGSAVKFIRAS